MKLLKHIPTIASAIRASATRPGHVPGVCPMLVGRCLHHPRLRKALESSLFADIDLMTDGSFRTRGWFDERFQPGRPALCGGLGNAGRTGREQRDARNTAVQEAWL